MGCVSSTDLKIKNAVLKLQNEMKQEIRQEMNREFERSTKKAIEIAVKNERDQILKMEQFKITFSVTGCGNTFVVNDVVKYIIAKMHTYANVCVTVTDYDNNEKEYNYHFDHKNDARAFVAGISTAYASCLKS
jgi:hypothetical protein